MCGRDDGDDLDESGGFDCDGYVDLQVGLRGYGASSAAMA
jgi:hypothetical protein